MVLLIVAIIQPIRLKNNPVIIMNGEIITEEEINQRISTERSGVIDYFYNKYQVEPDENFWETSYEGEIPGEMLKKAAIEQCIYIKSQQILAKGRGLVDDISYTNFLRNLKEENKRRTAALSENQVIYGPQQYAKDSYFDVIFTQLVYELREILDEEFICSEIELKSYYEEGVKQGYYHKAGTVEIEIIEISSPKDGDNSNNITKKKVEELRKRSLEGESFQLLSTYFTDRGADNISFREQILDENTRREDNRPGNYEFTKEVEKLQQGDISNVFVIDNTYYIVKCIRKSDKEMYEFGQVKEAVTEAVKQQKYNEYVNEFISNADIVINEGGYKMLRIK